VQCGPARKNRPGILYLTHKTVLTKTALKGFYGDVYRGILERESMNKEPELVAVKRLKGDAISSCLQDFEREIAIMKVFTANI
jgi:Protein tyrosine and serine/threonine kinase